jgi:hypothetical protein
MSKKDIMSSRPFDELYTPEEAIKVILSYIPDNVKVIWEPTAILDSKIVLVLEEAGYKVVKSHINDGKDFFTYEPEEYDMIITNPPYSIKDKFLKRAFQLGKPFMFLLPITTLEGKVRGKMFSENKIQVIIPNKRFNFMKDKKGAWFQTSWFCSEVNLKQDLIFLSI